MRRGLQYVAYELAIDLFRLLNFIHSFHIEVSAESFIYYLFQVEKSGLLRSTFHESYSLLMYFCGIRNLRINLNYQSCEQNYFT